MIKIMLTLGIMLLIGDVYIYIFKGSPLQAK